MSKTAKIYQELLKDPSRGHDFASALFGDNCLNRLFLTPSTQIERPAEKVKKQQPVEKDRVLKKSPEQKSPTEQSAPNDQQPIVSRDKIHLSIPRVFSDMEALFTELGAEMSERTDSPLVRQVCRPDHIGAQVMIALDVPNQSEVVAPSFCLGGEAGSLLNRMLGAMGLNPEISYSTLLVKQFESDILKKSQLADDYWKYFLAEIEIIRPKFILGMGAFVANRMTQTRQRLSTIQGKVFDLNLELPSGEVYKCFFVPLFHPEYLLINPGMKKNTWESMQEIMKLF